MSESEWMAYMSPEPAGEPGPMTTVHAGQRNHEPSEEWENAWWMLSNTVNN